MMDFLAAGATEEHNWSNNFYYRFKEGKVVHWGGWLAVTGQLTSFSLLELNHLPWSPQILKCWSRDFKALPLIVFKEAPWQCSNSCLATLQLRLASLGKGRVLAPSLPCSRLCSKVTPFS